jgi:hypothetical protein
MMMDTIVFDHMYYDNNLLSLVKHLVDKKIVTVLSLMFNRLKLVQIVRLKEITLLNLESILWLVYVSLISYMLRIQ